MNKYLKIIILAIVGILFSHGADAQLFISGGMATTKDYAFDSKVGISPEVGYKFSGNKYLGFQATFFRSEHSSVSRALHLSPYLRWDFLTDERWNFGLMAMPHYSKRQIMYYGDLAYEDFSIGAMMRMAVDFNITEKFSITGQFAVADCSHNTYNADNLQKKNNGFCAKFNIGEFFLGIKYTL